MIVFFCPVDVLIFWRFVYMKIIWIYSIRFVVLTWRHVYSYSNKLYPFEHYKKWSTQLQPNRWWISTSDNETIRELFLLVIGKSRRTNNISDIIIRSCCSSSTLSQSDGKRKKKLFFFVICLVFTKKNHVDFSTWVVFRQVHLMTSSLLMLA